MKHKSIGQKLYGFGSYLGSKLYSGSKAVGQKIYDNRYKILAGLATALVAGAVYKGSEVAQNIGNVGQIKQEFRNRFAGPGFRNPYPYLEDGRIVERAGLFPPKERQEYINLRYS